MPTQLTAEQATEARIFIARNAGERLIGTKVGGIEVRYAEKTINLSDMSNKEFLEYLHCRDTLNRSFGIMSKEKYEEIPASARQFADNLAFELIVEKHVLNNKADLDMIPHLAAPFITKEIIQSLKADGFTAKNNNNDDVVTVGDIRKVITDIFRDHNMTDDLEDTLVRVNEKIAESGISFIKPENHIVPKIEPEPEPKQQPTPAPKVEVTQQATLSEVVAKPPEPDTKQEVESAEPQPLSGDDAFIVIPNTKKNNVIIHSAIAKSLKETEFQPLDIRSRKIADTLAQDDIFLSSDLDILVGLPKDELVEESAANIISPLEEVEFESTMDDGANSQRVVAAKLLKSMKLQDIHPMIDKDSLSMKNFEAKPAPKQAIAPIENKVEEKEPEVHRMSPSRY